MNLFSLIVDKTTPFFGLSLSLIETHSLLLFTLLLIKAVCFSVNLKSQLFYATVLSFCFVNQHRIEHKLSINICAKFCFTIQVPKIKVLILFRPKNVGLKQIDVQFNGTPWKNINP